MFITGEDDLDVLRSRQRRICEALALDRAQLDGKLFIRSMTDTGMFLWRDGKATKLAEQLATDLASIRPMLVIIDSAVFAFDDEEIKRRPVAGFLVHLNGLARTLEAWVGLVTHTSRPVAFGIHGVAEPSPCRSAPGEGRRRAHPQDAEVELRQGPATHPAPLGRSGVLMSEQPDTGFVGKLTEKKLEEEVLAGIKERVRSLRSPFVAPEYAHSLPTPLHGGKDRAESKGLPGRHEPADCC